MMMAVLLMMLYRRVLSVVLLKEPLLLYKLLTNNTPPACGEPRTAEPADSSPDRGPLPDLSYDDSQFSCDL